MKKYKSKVLNTEHYAVEIKETDEGVIIDVFHRHGDLINTYTYFNDDVIGKLENEEPEFILCSECQISIDINDSIETINNNLICHGCDTKRLIKEV